MDKYQLVLLTPLFKFLQIKLADLVFSWQKMKRERKKRTETEGWEVKSLE